MEHTMFTYEKKDGKITIKGCTSNQTTVVIPSEIEKDAFRGCTSLTSVVIPDSVVRLDKKAFRGCVNLAEIVLPESLEYMRDEVMEMGMEVDEFL